MKGIRSVLSRNGIDISRLDVRVQGGVAHIRGYVKALPNIVIPDLEIEMQRLANVIRQKPEVRTVILEVSAMR